MAIYADDLGGNSLSATKNESMLYRGGEGMAPVTTACPERSLEGK